MGRQRALRAAAQPCPVVMGCSLAGKGQGEWRTNSRAAGKIKSTPAVIFQQKTTKQSLLVWRMIPRPDTRFYRRSWCKKRRWPLSTQLDDSLRQMLCPQNERPVYLEDFQHLRFLPRRKTEMVRLAKSHVTQPPHPPQPPSTSSSPSLSPPRLCLLHWFVCLFRVIKGYFFFSHFHICHLHIPPAFLCLGHNSLQGQQSYFETSNTMSLCLFFCFVILTEYNKQKVL